MVKDIEKKEMGEKIRWKEIEWKCVLFGCIEIRKDRYVKKFLHLFVWVENWVKGNMKIWDRDNFIPNDGSERKNKDKNDKNYIFL